MKAESTKIPTLLVKNNVIASANAAFGKMLSIPPDSIEGKPFEEIMVGTNDPGGTPSQKIPPLNPDGSPQVVMLNNGTEIPTCAEMSLSIAERLHNGAQQIEFRPLTTSALKAMRDDLRRNQIGVNVWDVGLFEHHHLEGKIFSSARLREMYGLPPDKEMTFMEFGMAVHPDDRDTEGVKKSHDPNGDGQYENQFRIIRPNGEIRWIHGRTQTTFGDIDGEKRALYTTGTMFDITEQHLLKTALEENKQKLTDILNAIPSVVLGVDTTLQITQWNRMAETHTGIPESEALGRGVSEIYPMLSAEVDNIRKSQQARTTINRPRIPWSEGKETRFFDICITPLQDSQSQDVVIRIDDVSDQVRFEEMLVHSEKLLSVGGLAAGMAHEINNPLAAVLQNIQVIANRFDPTHPINQQAAKKVNVSIDGVRAYLEERNIPRMIEAVGDAGARAATIVKNMLSFVRISNEKKQACQLSELADTTLDLALYDYDLAKKTDFRKIDICREYAADIREVICDQGKIQQVLLNLIKNAGQALFEAQTPVPRITIRIHRHGKFIRMEFEDNGPGIPADMARRIFEPFFTTKPLGTGTGLGLSISYHIIVEEHGGTIRVEKAPGGGARFIIDLP